MVQLLDLDPQASTSKWWRRRKGPENPMLVSDIKNMTVFMASLKKRGEPDVLVIDTPGSMLGVIRDAVGVADVIVIPLAPSVKDWEAMDAVESIIATAGKRDRALYIINRYRVGTDTSVEAVRALKERAVNPPLAVGLRTAYEKADAAGLTGPELNNEAAKEIELAWNTIKGLAGHG
jgi:chromosome partitioning protein